MTYLRTTLLVFFLSLFSYASCLKFEKSTSKNIVSDCEILEKASIAYCHKDYNEALIQLKLLKQIQPKHPLIREIDLIIAQLYNWSGELNNAIKANQELINGNYIDNSALSVISCTTSYDNYNCMRIVFPEGEKNILHQAYRNISSCYEQKGDLKLALSYLDIANENYPYSYGCGNGDAMYNLGIAMHYADLYKKLGRDEDALKKLVIACLETEKYMTNINEAKEEAINLIKKLNIASKLKADIDESVNHIEVISDFSYNGISHKQFGFKLWNITIAVISQNKRKVEEEVKETTFYKALEQLL